MSSLSLREAAGRTSLSITTLRRYIRNGRLRAEKKIGRYGPEYFIEADDLAQAGIEAPNGTAIGPAAIAAGTGHSLHAALTQAIRGAVPIALFQELQLKHEQLLVQYGMMRAAGLRTLEMQAELESRRRQADEASATATRLKERATREATEIARRIREVELEAEGLRLENAALREKVRGLELLTRNAVTTESIDKQYDEVMRQMRRVDELVALHDTTNGQTPDH